MKQLIAAIPLVVLAACQAPTPGQLRTRARPRQKINVVPRVIRAWWALRTRRWTNLRYPSPLELFILIQLSLWIFRQSA